VDYFYAKVSEYYNICNRYEDKTIGNDFVFCALGKYLIYSVLMYKWICKRSRWFHT